MSDALTLGDPYASLDSRKRQLDERRRLLQEQARSAQRFAVPNMPEGRMVSGIYVRPSLGQVIAAAAQPLIQQYALSKDQQRLDAEQRAYDAEEASAATELVKRLGSRQEQYQAPGFDEADAAQASQGMKTVREPTRQEKLETMAEGMKIPSLRDTLTRAFQDQLVNEPIREEARAARKEDREDRQAAAQSALDANLQLRREQLKQQAEAAAQRAEDARLSREDRAQARAEANALRQQMLALQRDALEARKADADARRTAATAPKPLTVGELQKVQAVYSTAQEAARFRDTFKDEYAGLGSDIRRAAGSILPASMTTESMKSTSDWWRDYQARKNKVRNELFGAALTAQEKSEWEKSDVNPDMDPARIRENLTRRAQLEERAAAKLEAAISAGTRQGQLDALKGAPSATASRVGPGATPRVGDVVDGWRFKGGNPADPRSWSR